MNRTANFVYPVIAALSLAAAFAAHAETPAPAQLAETTFVAGKTRADVMAEFHQARRTKEMRVASISYNPLAEMKVTTSREAVKAEALAMNTSGRAHEMTGEDSGSFALAPVRSVRPVPALTLAQR